jgi:hypothetical protein
VSAIYAFSDRILSAAAKRCDLKVTAEASGEGRLLSNRNDQLSLSNQGAFVMTRTTVAAACLALTLSATAAQAQLAISKIEASHGRVGPARQSREYFQGDQVFFRFVVSGAQMDKAGELNVEISLVLVDADGNKVLDNRMPLKGQLALGGGTFLGEAQVNLGPNLTPGKYTLTVGVKDCLSNETASFDRQFVCKAAELAIVAVRFFNDAQGKAPAPFGGTLGQTLFFQHKAIGFDRQPNEIHMTMNYRLLDENGKEVTPQPFQTSVRANDPNVIKGATHVDFQGELVLNRVGNFALRITVTDCVANRTCTFDTPLRVTAP